MNNIPFLLDCITNIPIDNNHHRNNFLIEEIPILIRTDILHLTIRIVVDPTRRIDMTVTFRVVAWRGTICRSRIRRLCRRGNTLSPFGHNAWGTEIARRDGGVRRGTVLDGVVFGNPLRVYILPIPIVPIDVPLNHFSCCINPSKYHNHHHPKNKHHHSSKRAGSPGLTNVHDQGKETVLPLDRAMTMYIYPVKTSLLPTTAGLMRRPKLVPIKRMILENSNRAEKGRCERVRDAAFGNLRGN